jgi:hypothetical protein
VIGISTPETPEDSNSPSGCNYYEPYASSGFIWFNTSNEEGMTTNDNSLVCRANIGICLTNVCSSDADCSPLETDLGTIFLYCS